MSSTVLSHTLTRDIYRTITDKIIAAIKAGAGEYRMPWHRVGPSIGRPTNTATKNRYRGVNVIALWAEAYFSGFESGHWATYRQWQTIGAQVRKGSIGTPIVFYKSLDADDDGREGGEQSPRQRLLARSSYVFNAEQVDGWSGPETGPQPCVADVLADVEAFVVATGAAIEIGGSRACYVPDDDIIEMPDRGRFFDTPSRSTTEAYYSVLLHELVHWTGAAHRLDRNLRNRFGSAAYAAEELVAEIGAAFLCADLRVSAEPRPDHAAYVATWVDLLEYDSRTILHAASLADKATGFLSLVTG